jgi:predicted transcriptional regulator
MQDRCDEIVLTMKAMRAELPMTAQRIAYYMGLNEDQIYSSLDVLLKGGRLSRQRVLNKRGAEDWGYMPCL